MSENYLDKVTIDGVDCNLHDVGARSDIDDLLNNQIIATAGPSSIVSISDGAEFKARDLTVEIEPVQDLHGYDNPWPAGGGVNLIDVPGLVSSGITYGLTISFDGDWIVLAGTYSNTSSTPQFRFARKSDGTVFPSGLKCFPDTNSGSHIGSAAAGKADSNTTLTIFLTNMVDGETYNLRFKIVGYEGASAPTSWTPYSNICPITGHTAVNVTRTGKNLLNPAKKHYTQSNMYFYYDDGLLLNAGTYILSYKGSETMSGIYVIQYSAGGSAIAFKYNIKSLTFTIQKQTRVIFNYYLAGGTALPDDATKYQLEVGSTDTDYEPYTGTTYPITFPSEAGTVYGGTLDVTTGLLTVTHGNIASYNGESLPDIWISSMDVYSAGGTPTTGAQVVYELATPVTYQLTPTEVSLLKGHNNIWADTGDSTLTYIPDINNLISEVDDLKSEIGTTALPTTAQTITGAIAEHETDITSVRTTANGSVQFNKSQSISSANKAQARANIGAASDTSVETLNTNMQKCVKYTSQTLTDSQKEQARTNIGAASETETDALETLVGNTALPTTAQTVTGAIAEHETDISNINSAIGTVPSGSNLQGEVDDLKSDIGTVPSGKTVQGQVDALTTRIDAIEEAEGLHKYGVSGVGQSASALTRLWDSVGMTAQVGTDGDNSNIVNNFDDVMPFNRRKCVGGWTLVEGKPVFHVHAYYGDVNYAEDGTMGDYVAVECPRAYYYFKDGTLGVSAHQWQGWRPFDIFCKGHNPENTMPYVYLPAYALALKDGKAVSLPGLDNLQGNYKELMDATRTYGGGSLGTEAFLQPMAVNFYEWALFTVEFAQQNCQNVMYGCASLRNNNDDRATLRSDGKWLLNNYQAARVVGEYISLQPTNVDINTSTYYASHKITALTRCDVEGNASSSGAYTLMETEDLGVGREYTVGSEYRIAARPYRTGACNGVSTPSGSPVSNSNGYYPMKYRWRENVYSNQYKTISDFFNQRMGTGDDDYYLDWYYLPDPAGYTPSSSSKPDATDLASDRFLKLDVGTAHANYVSGYIKSKKYSEEYPDLWIPYETTGGSASTYYADYASLVVSYVVRSVRLGGYWYYGSSDGFSYLYGYNDPSSGYAYFGGDLFVNQWG